MARHILVTVEYDKSRYRLEIPDDAHVTFGPWSPPSEKQSHYEAGRASGTLRVYASDKPKAQILYIKSHVVEFMDTSQVKVLKEVHVETGATTWQSSSDGQLYREEKKVETESSWKPALPELGEAPF